MEITRRSATFLLLFLVASSFLLPSFSSALCVPRDGNFSGLESLAPSLAPLPSAGAPAPSQLQEPSLSGHASHWPFFRLPFGLPAFSASPALKQICDKTAHSDECVASIVPFLSGQVDTLSVFKAELHALNKGFKDGLSLINTLYYGANIEVQSCLDVCLDVYQSGDSDFSDAITALAKGDLGTLRVVLSAAVGYPDTCEDAFEEREVDNPLRENDDLLGILASNCLAIAEFLPSV